MMLKTYIRRSAIVAMLLIGFAARLYAQDLTQREKDMMALIESLQERVSALEKEVAASKTSESSAGGELEDRVVALESKVTEETAAEPNDFRVFWKDGLNMVTADGQAKLQIGGRVHNDWFWYDQDDGLQADGDLEDGTEFRRARIYLSGKLYENLEFKTEYDFEEGDASFKDVFLEMSKIPGVQNLRVGHFKEPFSLEELVSSNDITFMERALPNVFAPSRNTGAMLHGAFLGEPTAERVTAAAGIFRTTDDFGNDADDGGYSGTVRVTGLPWYAEHGRRLVHLGAAYTHRNPDGEIRIRQRPEAHDAGHFVDTGVFLADDIDSLVLEAALVYGAFSLQGEYFLNDVNSDLDGDLDFDGYYAQASYFLTGEHRPYKNSGAIFSRVVPNHNLKFHGEDRGWGAWEVALRYSAIDLDDGQRNIWDLIADSGGEIRGGQEDNITVGINWYLNPNARIMLNYVHARIEDDNQSDQYAIFLGREENDLNIFQSRFQLAF